MYETFEHTADLGLRIRAGDLNSLFAEAGRGLFSILVDDLDTVESRRKLELSLTSEGLEYLLFDWLRELLYCFESQRVLLGRFEVSVEGASLSGSAWGELMDSARHAMMHEVKAITYHGLRLEKEREGWLAEVIVDI
jgi:SHS2 domain-containing protein